MFSPLIKDNNAIDRVHSSQKKKDDEEDIMGRENQFFVGYTCVSEV